MSQHAETTLETLLREVRALLEARRSDEARRLLASNRDFDPGDSRGWSSLAEAWRAAGEPDIAADAHLRSINAAVREPDMVAAAQALTARDYPRADALLRERLTRNPNDAGALAMLGDVAVRTRRFDDADRALARAVALAPGFTPARQSYAFTLYSRGRNEEALVQIDAILARTPADHAARDLKAALLSRQGDEEGAIAIDRALLAEAPDRARASWLRLGHSLKAVGNTDEAVAAYHEALSRRVTVGQAYWSLANLKTYHFTEAEIADLRAVLDDLATPAAERAPAAFALGKALEDAGQDEAAFAAYAQGNALRRAATAYDADEIAGQRRRAEALFDAGFFAARPGGCPSPEPIFIVGLPRSGSTLIEQILASHPRVERTRELPFLSAIVQRLDARTGKADAGRYPEILATLTTEQRRDLGREYLDRAGTLRRDGKPYFIDKLPNNFLHVGLIRLILPNARIIDARRHPLATGFSCFKQHFANQQQFSYDLTEIGRYYADYVAVMDAYDRALPGHVHRVFHERLIDDVESEVRALLAYLNLPFDAACLRPHENRQTVRTPSAEQVRQPITRDGADQWRRFLPWLGPLENALGPLTADYEAQLASHAPLR